MSSRLFGILADIVVWFHLAFVLFAALGAILVIWRHRVVWLHLPAVFWAIWIELSGGICPLTPLEKKLWRAGGRQDYAGGFLVHYLGPMLNLESASRRLEVQTGVVILGWNLMVYLLVWSVV